MVSLLSKETLFLMHYPNGFIPLILSRLFWTILFLLNTPLLKCQPSFETLVKIDGADGLPNVQINCSHLDKMGFLWLGTKKGLFRYDGKSFQNPLMEDIDIGKNIKCFAQVDSLHFLVGTDYGLVKINSLNFDYQYLNLENIPNTNRKSNHIQEIRKTKENEFWIVATGGIFKLDSKLKVQNNFNFEEEEVITASNLQPPRICEFSENEIWVVAPIASQNDAYHIYSINDNTIEHLKDNPFPDVKRFLSLLNINKEHCLFLYETTEGKVVSGMIEIKTRNVKYLDTPLIKFQSHQPFFSILNDSLIGLDSKGFSDFLVFNSKKKKWHTYKKTNEIDYFKSVHFLKGNLFGVTNQDLYVTSAISQPIHNIPISDNGDARLENRVNYLECNGYKIISNNHTINITDLAQKEHVIQINNRTDIRINQLTELSKKEIILSTNKGTYLFDLKNLKISRLSGIGKPNFFDTLTSKAFKFNSKEIWFGFVQFKGLVKYSIPEKRFEHYPFNVKNENTFFHDVTTIINDDVGNLWLGWIGGGLAKFDTKAKKILVQPQSNYKDAITCMTKDNKGVIWFGTNGYGVYHFHPDSMQFKRLNKRYDPYISSIICDAKNNIWFTNNTALIKLNQKNHDLLVLTKKQGLLAYDYEKIVYDRHNRNIILSSTQGISIINESITKEVKIENTFYINRIYINNKRVNERIKTLNLKYNENNVIIQFSISNIKNGNDDRYYFSIDNNRSWQPCSSGEILLTGIKNGKYRVILKTCNNDNQCYQKEVLQINVATPFWKSINFFTLITLIICLILYLFFRQRINSIKKINDLKFKIARDLHDSIGASLSSIALLSKAVVNKNITYEKQITIAQKITDAALDAGNNIEEIIWNLQPKDKTVFEIINRTINQFEEVFSAKGIHIEINKNEETDKYILTNLATINLLMILKEILNNVLKHSKADRLILNMKSDNKMLMIEALDNGIGFDANTAWGNGLDNIKSRILEIKGTIQIETKVNVGTRILISLPF